VDCCHIGTIANRHTRRLHSIRSAHVYCAGEWAREVLLVNSTCSIRLQELIVSGVDTILFIIAFIIVSAASASYNGLFRAAYGAAAVSAAAFELKYIRIYPFISSSR
jgi:hypothetical protein